MAPHERLAEITGVAVYFADVQERTPVFTAMAKNEPDYISSDCAIAGRHIEQGMTEAGAAGRKEKQHPLALLRIALWFGVNT